MIINFHEHPASAEERMERYGIDMAVLLPVGREAQEKAVSMASREPERYVPFMWIPDLDGKDLGGYVARCAEEQGCRGVKFQPLLQHFDPEDRRLFPVYARCQELGLVVLFHCGMVGFPAEFGTPHLSRYANPVHGLDRVAWEYPELKIVVCHMGGNYAYEALVLAEKRPNVYLDTAYLHFFCDRLLPEVSPAELITRAVRVIGANRILYGSEGVPPALIRECGLPEREEKMILEENARRLLGI